MIDIVKKHYDEHLSGFYSWMSGDFSEKVSQVKQFFTDNGILPSGSKYAVDLGSGHGIQSQALTELGFTVTAVDFSEQLLNELKQNTGSKVKRVNTDLTKYQYSAENTPELVVCMGDTLTHLASTEDVKSVIYNAALGLGKQGKIVLSYRDMTSELTGTSRFIPVKSDENMILTCFLEYFENYVNVNDILYKRNGDKWEMKVSSYPKLRLSKETVYGYLTGSGFDIILTNDMNGLHYIIAQKIN